MTWPLGRALAKLARTLARRAEPPAPSPKPELPLPTEEDMLHGKFAVWNYPLKQTPELEQALRQYAQNLASRT